MLGEIETLPGSCKQARRARHRRVPETSRVHTVEIARALNEIGIHVDVVPYFFEVLPTFRCTQPRG